MQQSWGQKRGLFLKFVADLRRQKTRKTRKSYVVRSQNNYLISPPASAVCRPFLFFLAILWWSY
jgi:hypothetical protein